MTISKQQFKRLRERDMFCMFKCDECGSSVAVDPSFMAVEGTPQCDKCDVDMRYVYTKLRLKEKANA